MVCVTVFTITEVLHEKSISCNTFVMVLTVTYPSHIFSFSCNRTVTFSSITELLQKICNDFVTILNDSPDIEQGSPLHKGDKESIQCNHEAAGRS